MTADDGTAGTLAAFDPRGALPTGTALLEASAGTGKTYAVAGLTARYVAEAQVPLGDVLVVTFGRAATSEVRERVRDRLATGAQVLASGVPGDDPYLAALAEATEREVRARAERLRRAVSQFDAATIVTTHQFCSRVLAGLGMSGGADPRTTVAERSDDLVAEAVVEVYLRDVAGDAGGSQALPFGVAREVGRAAVADVQAALVPSGQVPDEAARARVRFAAAVRRKVVARRRARLQTDYDDLLVQVRDALADPVTGPATAARLRRRYRVVLVDEFQDTDPLQWQILRLAFHGHVPLVLIGDPKQAIYAFRGGDLHTYLDAAGAASTAATLAVNWRADPAVVGGVQRLLAGAALGDPRIAVHRVEAGLSGARLEGPAAPVRLRVLTTEDGPCDRTGRLLTVGGARPAVARDVAAVTVDLLAGSARYRAPDGPRSLRPGDVAVLVRTNKQADLVRDHLAAAGVPAVLSGARSVFRTDAARAWLTLLRALEEPHRPALVHAAALTMLVGTPPRLLADGEGAAGDAARDELGRRMRSWREAWTGRGVPALVEQVVDAGLLSRLLATPAGERHLTDVRHVAEALHRAAVVDRLGPTAQREWLAAQVADADAESGDLALERSRRLESDRDAVQVLTVHAAKGQEFPVVLVPFGWDRFVPRSPATLLLHGDDGARLLHVGGPSSPDYDASRRRAQAEDADEELRSLYVAVTRAASHLVLWWAPGTTTATAPLHRVLFGQFAAGQVPPDSVEVPSDRDVHARLTARAERGLLAVQRAAPRASASWSAPQPAPPLDGVARFDRSLDLRWGRLSYTSLTSHQQHGGGGPAAEVEPEQAGTADEPAAERTAAPHLGTGGVSTGADEGRLRSLRSAWDALPAGTAFGTLVHAVLEQVDPGGDDLDAQLNAVCEQQVARRPGARVDPAVLAEAVRASLDTPLGRLAGGRRLRDVPRADRLAELAFELPLAGGDRADRQRATVAEVAGLLRRHLPPDDPLVGYPDVLAGEGLGDRPLGGYLVGSIDAVLRLPSQPGPRYSVVDYKTTLVRTDGEPLSAWQYQPDLLAPLMVAAHYPLQALLYSVALHRLLRWRQPGYDPAVHLGGVLYLFVRGMVGAQAHDREGRPCGVFAWEPPARLVVETSALLAGGAR